LKQVSEKTGMKHINIVYRFVSRLNRHIGFKRLV
jgi:hypothetical protein